MNDSTRQDLDSIPDEIWGGYLTSLVLLNEMNNSAVPKLIAEKQEKILGRKRARIEKELRARELTLAPGELAEYLASRAVGIYRKWEDYAIKAAQESGSGEFDPMSPQKFTLDFMVEQADGLKGIIEDALRGYPLI
jgi:hypothetical protein